MDNFDEVDHQEAYTRAQGKYNETVNIASISCQMGRKIQAQKKTATPPGFNTEPAKYPSIKSGLTQEASEDEYDSLLGGLSLYLDP